MNCYKCKRQITEYQWATKSDKGPRHLTCPNPRGKSAARRRVQLARFKRERQLTGRL